MLRQKILRRPRFTSAKCWYSTGSNNYDLQLHSAREDINSLLEVHDRSSYILAQYIPEPARDAFLAIRAFNLEINKINDGGNNTNSVSSKASNQLSGSMGISTTDIKFKFWSDLLSRVFTDPSSEKNLGEPIAILVRDALRNDLNLDLSYFHQFLQTRKHFLQTKSFQTVNDICSYGEGTYSQLNYLTQGLLLSPSISPSAISLLEHSTSLQSKVSDIAAHIGQATAIGSMILGLKYYSSTRNQVTLPIDLMTKFDLSQESVLRLTQGHLKDEKDISDVREKLKNITYETAVIANDHILSARDKLDKSREEILSIVKSHPNDQVLQKHQKRWRKNIPDVVFTPFMVAIPTTLYLQKLEKYDFDIFHPKLQQQEWRLAWTSFRNYYQKKNLEMISIRVYSFDFNIYLLPVYMVMLVHYIIANGDGSLIFNSFLALKRSYQQSVMPYYCTKNFKVIRVLVESITFKPLRGIQST